MSAVFLPILIPMGDQPLTPPVPLLLTPADQGRRGHRVPLHPRAPGAITQPTHLPMNPPHKNQEETKETKK